MNSVNIKIKRTNTSDDKLHAELSKVMAYFSFQRWDTRHRIVDFKKVPSFAIICIMYF